MKKFEKSFLPLMFTAVAILAVFGVWQERRQINETTSQNTNQVQEIDTRDWLTYRDEELGISFRYPNEWEVYKRETQNKASNGTSILIRERGGNNGKSNQGDAPPTYKYIDINIFPDESQKPLLESFNEIIGLSIQQDKMVSQRTIASVQASYFCGIPGFIEHCATIFEANKKLFYIIHSDNAIYDAILDKFTFL